MCVVCVCIVCSCVMLLFGSSVMGWVGVCVVLFALCCVMVVVLVSFRVSVVFVCLVCVCCCLMFVVSIWLFIGVIV